jgi:hypothetical protein
MQDRVVAAARSLVELDRCAHPLGERIARMSTVARKLPDVSVNRQQPGRGMSMIEA